MTSQCFAFVLVICSFNFIADGVRITSQLRCSDGDLKVFVIDKFLPKNDIHMAENLSEGNRPWILNSHCSGIEGEEECLDVKTSAAWMSPIAPEVFQGFRMWRRLSRIIKELAKKEYYVCNAMITGSNRMDFNEVSQDKVDESGLTARIFLNTDMKKNHYGENVFYKADMDDVMCGIHPIPGRAVLWNSTIGYSPKPPSMLFSQRQNSILLKLTDSEGKHKKCQEQFKKNEKIWSESRPEDFPFFEGGPVKLQSVQNGDIDFEEHLTNKYFDSRGRAIAVFDNVLTKQELDTLREYLAKDYYTFNSQPYDAGATEDNDNVAWISSQKVAVFAKSDLWQVVKQSVTYLSGLDEWYAYDVAMNIIHSFDHSRIHEDCERHEYEYTFLMYLNPDWQQNYYGETVFFDEVNTTRRVKKGNEQYEMVAAVLPKYGRIALFRNTIPHSARPPSVGFKGPRYTFACKVSKTYRTSTAKQLRETLEYNDEIEQNPKIAELYEELLNGEHDEKSKGRPDDFLEKELRRQKKMFVHNAKESLRDVINELSR